MGLLGPDRPRGLSAGAVRAQRPWWLLVFVAALAIASLGPLASLASGGRIAAMDLMSDPVEITGAVWYIGAVSDLNLMVWAAGAAIFLLAAFGLRRTDARLAAALAWLGVLTVALTLDDRFVLHEIVLPSLFGIPEIVTYLAYAVAVALILVRYRAVLLHQPEVTTLVLALLALATSVTLDVAGWDLTARRVAEETAKLVGTVAWASFPAAIIVRHLTRSTRDAPRQPGGPPTARG